MERLHFPLYAVDTRDGTIYVVVGWQQTTTTSYERRPYLAPMTGPGGAVVPAHSDQCRHLRYSVADPRPLPAMPPAAWPGERIDPSATAVLPLTRPR